MEADKNRFILEKNVLVVKHKELQEEIAILNVVGLSNTLVCGY